MKRVLNWKKDPDDTRDFMYAAHVPPPEIVPPSQVDNSEFDSGVKDQGQLGCCVGEGSCAANEQIEKRLGTAPYHGFSILFAYYNARTDKEEDTGAFIRDSIKAMAKYGLARARIWPFRPDRFAHKPPSHAYDDAATRSIKDYLRLGNIAEIRQALAECHPVIFGFTCFESLMNDSTAKTGIVPMPKTGEQEIGGHCVILVGYDDTAQLFKFKNSWGKSWGKKGYGFLPYEYFTRNYASDIWVIRK